MLVYGRTEIFGPKLIVRWKGKIEIRDVLEKVPYIEESDSRTARMSFYSVNHANRRIALNITAMGDMWFLLLSSFFQLCGISEQRTEKVRGGDGITYKVMQ